VSAGFRRALQVALIAFLAALAGVLIGRSLANPGHSASNAIHDLLHDELDLDAAQLRQINRLETQFAARRRALELELRAENARLAAAIEAEHGFGPRVAAEVERTHATMGTLQKETLAHIFAMRAVLRPEQAVEFDRVVFETLTSA
jgi:Spy/CpxP family protein refolding chaperone